MAFTSISQSHAETHVEHVGPDRSAFVGFVKKKTTGLACSEGNASDSKIIVFYEFSII